MATTELTLGSWDGDPVALIKRDDGTMEGYLWTGSGWKPGYTEEAFTKAKVLSDRQFSEAFPGVEPPGDAP